MTQTSSPNGRAQRKSLAGEIDRLDGILDGLAEALDESVADAVRGAVGHAVKEAVDASVRELLSSPALLRAALAAHGPQAEPAPPRPTLRQRLRGALGRLMQKVATAAAAARGKLREGFRKASGVCRAARWLAGGLAGLALRHRGAACLALAAGALAAAGAYLAGPAVCSFACGLAGAAAAAAAAALRRLRQMASLDNAD